MLSELLPEEKRKLHELEELLNDLERGNTNTSISDFDISLKDMISRLDELEKLANKESIGRRDDMRRRVLHLKTSCNHMKSSFNNLKKRLDNQYFDAKKYELLGGHTGNSERFDIEAAENSSLARSGQKLMEYIETGRESLSELYSQKERLKNVQRKVLDVLHYLGISNSVLRIVERREITDKWIVIAGMIVITGLILVIYFYFRK